MKRTRHTISKIRVAHIRIGIIAVAALLVLIGTYAYHRSHALDLDEINNNGVIGGRILDAATGRPIREATLSASGVNYELLVGNGSATSGRSGNYEITGVPYSTGSQNVFRIEARKEGCEPVQVETELNYPTYRTNGANITLQCAESPPWWWWLLP